MNHFEYVSKSKYMPVKKELIKIINQVQDELREQFTFDYKFIGSSSRNMITYDPKTNKGYDFDINIEVNDFDENYSAKELKEILINTFNQVIKLTYPYASCQNNTRVFTIKVYEENPCCINIIALRSPKIEYSCDFAIVNTINDYQQEYIRFNKNTHEYSWQMQCKGYLLSKKEAYIKKNKLTNELRKIYLDKKNFNTNPNKKSRALYAEAVNELYNAHH
ncbi:hypothetical protein [Faecalibacillus intestinalis]|jgi:hypothetical protein|uniref:hypothetical protein n=1 Tax=Faecalibacillus intestinalis TaxID=1982626 RepID=UPI000E4D89FC|nr:hypothetical protein [Faecalibacillus intestinalis]RHP78298.1 hypothetical protein DXA62_00430 [Coprobacillus sp. OF03-2AA]